MHFIEINNELINLEKVETFWIEHDFKQASIVFIYPSGRSRYTGEKEIVERTFERLKKHFRRDWFEFNPATQNVEEVKLTT